ncbi:MAG: glycosyltransferase family 39 protein [Terracidiphilus sp.]
MSSSVKVGKQVGTSPSTETAILFVIAAGVVLLHILTNGRYGFHRDELQFLSDARHLDWGFVAYPPFDPFLERIGLSLFGLNMVGLRLFSVIAQATAVFVSGLIARDLGGSRPAQITAALVVAFSPMPLFNGTEFQYTSYDFLWWVLISFFTIRLLKSENPRWWIAIGAAVGLGLLTKYAIVFYIAGILAGLLFTPARRYFLSIWFWAGIALALLIFLPNFVWLVRHDFISYTFLQHIHARDVGEGRAEGFLKGQFFVCANLAAAPLWLAGVFGFLRERRYRMFAFMYFIPLALFFIGKGRNYYMAGAYPMLLAMGAVQAERWLRSLPRIARYSIATVYFAAFAFVAAYICAIVIRIRLSNAPCS